jgi:hypothetical protein
MNYFWFAFFCATYYFDWFCAYRTGIEDAEKLKAFEGMTGSPF